MIITFSTGWPVGLAMSLALFAICSIAVNPQAWREASWWVYAALGLAASAVAGLIWAERGCWLRLDADGMHVSMLGFEETHRWQDIDGGFAPAARFVGFNLRKSPLEPPPLAAVLLTRVNGYQRSLPARFGGLNAPQLARLLERSRCEHLNLPQPLEDD